jgi:exoribonuclease R
MMCKLYTKDYKTFGQNGEIRLERIDRGLPGDDMEYALGKSNWVVSHRAEHPTLVGLLDVKSKYIYGMSTRGVSQYLFTPYNESYPPFIVGYADKDKSHNKIVLVRFSDWPVGSKFPKGHLERVLGVAGDFKAEALALQWCASPWTIKFTSEQMLEQPQLSVPPPNNRVDLTDKWTINIDPPGCRDIDDVISVYKGVDKWHLVVTIADVAESVDTGSTLDIHASRTGQSVYSEFLPPRNMFPPALSEDLLSLIPGKRRLGVSIIYTFMGDVFITHKFAETIVENKESYTYENVRATADPENIKMIRAAASILGCKEADADDPHKWVETFMVDYNKKVARELSNAKVGVFRGQKTEVSLETYERICPELAHQAATFTGSDNILQHKSLNAEVYCYASSPIRRYVDVVNQRLLKIIISKEWEFVIISRDDDFSSLADTMNELQKVAKRQSRDDFFLKQLSLGAATNIVDGVVFDYSSEKERLKVYVPAWKRFVKVRVFKTDSQPPCEGEKVTLRYFYNADQVAWKNRIVFQIV